MKAVAGTAWVAWIIIRMLLAMPFRAVAWVLLAVGLTGTTLAGLVAGLANRIEGI